MSHDIESPYAPTRTILIDFDGTLVPFTWPEPPRDPFPGAVECVNRWYDAGYHVVIFTARAWSGWDALNGSRAEGIRQVKEWAERYGLKYHEISAEKRPCIMIVDDSAVSMWGAEFWGWKMADEALEEMLKGSHMNLKASEEIANEN